MNNIEKIKFGDQVFDLVVDGVKLGELGGSIAFQKGSVSFDSVEAILKTNTSITQIGVSGESDWSRSDLVYAEKLTKQADYVIGTEQTGDVLTDVKVDVMIAYFRTPDLQDRVTVLEKENESLKATVGTLVLSSLEV